MDLMLSLFFEFHKQKDFLVCLINSLFCLQYNVFYVTPFSFMLKVCKNLLVLSHQYLRNLLCYVKPGLICV